MELRGSCPALTDADFFEFCRPCAVIGKIADNSLGPRLGLGNGGPSGLLSGS